MEKERERSVSMLNECVDHANMSVSTRQRGFSTLPDVFFFFEREREALQHVRLEAPPL